MEKKELEELLKGCFEVVGLICPLKLLNIPRSQRQTFHVALHLLKTFCLCRTEGLKSVLVWFSTR